MICPKCKNVIPVTRFSCSKCGLELPVKNQEERFRAEKLARQIYAERESADQAAKEKERRLMQEELKAASASQGPAIQLSPLEDEENTVQRSRRRLVAIAALTAAFVSSGILVPSFLGGNMTRNEAVHALTPAREEVLSNEISPGAADADSAEGPGTPEHVEETAPEDVAGLTTPEYPRDDGQLLFGAPWMDAYALDMKQP